VHEAEKLSLEQIRLVVSASEGLRIESANRKQMYGWVESVLACPTGNGARGLLRRFLEKMIGLSRAQVSRPISGFTACRQVRMAEYRRHRFALPTRGPTLSCWLRSTRPHETLFGAATMSILKREFELYGKDEVERLAKISNGHLYNLRHSQRYRERLLHSTRTRHTTVSIGERRKPIRAGNLGFASRYGKSLPQLPAFQRLTY
jgi:hypothetical protein